MSVLQGLVAIRSGNGQEYALGRDSFESRY